MVGSKLPDLGEITDVAETDLVYLVHEPAGAATSQGASVLNVLVSAARLAGRSGGQVLYGGTDANDDLTLEPTSHGTKTTAYVLLAPSGGLVGIGVAAPSQALDLVGALELQDTTTSTTGVIYKGADRFIHNFHHPTGGGALPNGLNTFVGVIAGNFTMGATATETYHSSNNVGCGYAALTVNTIGFNNTAIGTGCLEQNSEGSYNTGIGYTALEAVTTGIRNTGVGATSLMYITAGACNVAIGHNAGRYQANGSTSLAATSNSIYIGYDSHGKDDSDSNSIVIGYQAIGLGANTIVLGNSSHTLTRLFGKVGNVDSPGAQLDIDQASSTGAVPVLKLDQGDVSEEFIRFVGTSTTDNTQSLIDAADLEDAGAIVGWLKIYVQDDQGTNPITDGVYWVPFYATPTHSA